MKNIIKRNLNEFNPKKTVLVGIGRNNGRNVIVVENKQC